MENDNLFQLIQSMSTVEKAFFTRYAALRKDSQHQYLELFEDLASPKPPPPTEMAKKYPRLNHRRAYLHEQLLHGLRSQGTNNRSVETKLGDFLFQYQLYMDRGMPKQARKALQKAGNLARSFEKWNFLLEVIYLERRLVLHLGRQKIKEEFEALEKSHAETIAIIELENRFLGAWERLLIIYRTGFQESSAKAEAKRIVEQAIFKDDSAQTSFKSAHYFHSANSIYAIISGNYPAHLQAQKVLIGIWEAHPAYIKESRVAYIALLSNYGNSCHMAEQYDELEEVLDRLKKIKTRTFAEQAGSFQAIAFLEQILLMNKGDFSNAKEIAKSTLNGIEKFKNEINTSRVHVLLYNIMILNFLIGEYSEVKKTIDKLMGERKFRIRRDIQSFIKILWVVVEYEFGNREMVESLIKNAEIYLRRNKFSSKFLKLFLKFMFKFSDFPADSPKKARAFARKAFEELRVIGELKEEQATVGVAELTAWLQSKAEERPIKDISTEFAQARG